jgi:hypothetical protein
MRDLTVHSVKARFRTLGGALVELREQQWRAVTGFGWYCNGCRTLGAQDDVPHYPDSELRAARRDANNHAAACRSC